MPYSAAQKRAYASKMAKARGATKKSTVYGRGAYKKRVTVRGRGDYKKDYGQRLGSVVGEGLQELLTQLGGIGGATKALSGMGSYAPSSFSVRSNKLAEGNDPPEVVNGKDGSFVIRHREFVKDIYTYTGNFSNDSIIINPGLQESFPWLATLAQNFEQYRVEGMIYEFRSNYGEGTQGALGSVIMATEYDTNVINFDNKIAMENHQYASSCKPSLSMLHPIECARSQTPITELCVRTAQTVVNKVEDTRLCDLGKFQIATVGVPTTGYGFLGELWCTYQIRFLKPRMANGAGAGIVLSDFFQNTAGIATATPMGTVATLTKGVNNGIGLTVGTDGTIIFPESIGTGVYYVTVLWTHSLSVAVQPVIGATANCTTVTANDPFIAQYQAPLPGESCSKQTRSWAITIGSQPVVGDGRATFQIQCTFSTSPSYMALFVTAIDGGLAPQTPYSMDLFTEYHLGRESSYIENHTPEPSNAIENSMDISLSSMDQLKSLVDRVRAKKANNIK